MTIDRPITIALIFLTVILLTVFLVVPEYNTYMKLRSDFAMATAKYDSEHEYYANIARVYADLQERKDDIKKIDNALPVISQGSQDAAIGKLIYYLQGVIRDSGLVASNLFVSKPPTSAKSSAVGSVKDIVFSTSLTGSYASLEQLLVSLEKSARIFEITSISFGSSSNPPYSFSLQVKTHSY